MVFNSNSKVWKVFRTHFIILRYIIELIEYDDYQLLQGHYKIKIKIRKLYLENCKKKIVMFCLIEK